MEKIFSEFNTSSFKEWKNKVNFDLKGIDYNSSMIWRSLEGIDVPPYLSSDYDFPKVSFKKFTSRPLRGAKIYHLTNNPKSISILKNLLRDKIDSLIIVVPSNYNFKELVASIDKIKFDIQFQFEEFDYYQIKLINKLSEKLIKGKKMYLNLDPISDFVNNGNWKQSQEIDLDNLKFLINNLNPNIHPISIKGEFYQNSGANISQQIAIMISTAVEYANLLGGSFLNKIQFRTSASSNFFFEISKIKVLRELINMIKEEYKLKGYSEIYLESSLRNKSIYSSHNNLIRTANEAFAAILAGVDTLFIHPHDYIYNHPNSSSSRIAYNQLNIIREEVMQHNVDNILDGNYLIDFIKNELIKKSLELFKSIESNGGFLVNVNNNYIQKKVIDSSKKEQASFDSGDLKMCGINYSIDEKEKISHQIRKFPFRKIRNRKVDIITLSRVRLAEKIEKEKLATEDK